MSNIRLTCDESPLAWPTNVKLTDLNTCDSCDIQVHSTQSGTLQILTRRQRAGDGVNIEESAGVGADYRGQRYAYEEAIFHAPGMHIFPGQKDVYPAEYHIHMKTTAAPFRFLTLVIPASHLVPVAGKGIAYFAACRQTPTGGNRPTLDTLLTEGQILQYFGPDVRGRTEANPTPANTCNSSDERQFLLVLNVASIRAADLYRIPREGSLSERREDWPAPGVRAKKAMPSDRLLKAAVLANPGIFVPKKTVRSTKSSSTTELECKPVEVVNGRDVINKDGKTVDIKKLLGLDTADEANAKVAAANMGYAHSAVTFFSTLLGLLLADWILGKLWPLYFSGPMDRLSQWEPFKIWVFLFISLGTDDILKMVGVK